MKWLMDRLREPSTWAGLSSLTLGVGAIAHVNEAPAIASAVQHSASSFTSGNWLGGAVALLGGIASIFVSEKGGK